MRHEVEPYQGGEKRFVSVDVEIQLMIVVDSHVAHLSVEILALRGWLSIPAGFNTSPQNTLTNFWRDLRADVRERFEATRRSMLDLLRC